jgi:hypothetical protein
VRLYQRFLGSSEVQETLNSSRSPLAAITVLKKICDSADSPELRCVCLCDLPRRVRVRVEIMGSHNCGIVGKSQLVLMMIDPMISTRTRSCDGAESRV